MKIIDDLDLDHIVEKISPYIIHLLNVQYCLIHQYLIENHWLNQNDRTCRKPLDDNYRSNLKRYWKNEEKYFIDILP
jgi:hypothetical protein